MTHIIDGYFYSWDGCCYTVVRKGTRRKTDLKTRKLTDELVKFEETIGYYSNLESIVKTVAIQITNTEQYSTLAEHVQALREVTKRLEDVVTMSYKE